MKGTKLLGVEKCSCGNELYRVSRPTEQGSYEEILISDRPTNLWDELGRKYVYSPIIGENTHHRYKLEGPLVDMTYSIERLIKQGIYTSQAALSYEEKIEEAFKRYYEGESPYAYEECEAADRRIFTETIKRFFPEDKKDCVRWTGNDKISVTKDVYDLLRKARREGMEEGRRLQKTFNDASQNIINLNQFSWYRNMLSDNKTTEKEFVERWLKNYFTDTKKSPLDHVDIILSFLHQS